MFFFLSLQTYKVYKGGVFTLTRLLIPAWITHYYVKYHVAVSPEKFQTLFITSESQMKIESLTKVMLSYLLYTL